MHFVEHLGLEGQHAFLGASKYAWLNYDEDKVASAYKSYMAAQRGTELHDYARRSILLRQKLPRSPKTLNMYVNDCIGFRMKPEQILYYSPNCFGTADAISFKTGLLRISDLKTGVTPVKMTQLEIYTALFCLEYGVKPGEIKTELRIYQNNEILYHEPEVDQIAHTMDRIVAFDKIIDQIKNEETW